MSKTRVILFCLVFILAGFVSNAFAFSISPEKIEEEPVRYAKVASPPAEALMG